MKIAVAALGAGICWLSGAMAALEVPISVREPAGIERQAEPVSGGIPLPAGRYRPDQPFALFEGAREIPLQALPLVVDEQGFLRWILLDFQADLPAGGDKRFVLKDQAPTARTARPLRVEENAEAVTVDTGAVRFSIARNKPFALFDSVAADGKQIVKGGGASYTDAFDNKRYAADKPESVTVEYAGPLRTTLCVRGTFQGDTANRLRYIARLTAWAGSGRVRVSYKLSNSNEAHYSYRQIADSSLTLTLAERPARTLFGAAKPVTLEGAKEGWMHQGLVNDMAGAAKIGAGAAELWASNGKEDIARGWMALALGNTEAYVCDLYFAEAPPRRMETHADELVLSGIAAPFEGIKDAQGRVRGRPFSGAYRTLFDCSHHNSQYLFDFAPQGAAVERWRGAQSAPHALVPPEWYSETEGLPFGRFGSAADELRCYDTWQWKHDAAKQPRGARRAGGRVIGHQDVHFDWEQDSLEALVLLYLRGGERSYYENCLAWSHFLCDIYAWRTDGWRFKDGGVWWIKNKPGPLGNRPQRKADPVTGAGHMLSNPKVGPDPRTMRWDMNAFAMDRCCYCHNWAAGLASWFCLTGERDAYEACLDLAEQHIDTQRRAFGVKPDGPRRAYSRDFNRSSYLMHAVRMIAPQDPFVAEASDYLAACYLQRIEPEPRGLVNGPPAPRAERLIKRWGPVKVEEWIKTRAGEAGWQAYLKAGVTMDANTQVMSDPKTGAKWRPIEQPATWMHTPIVKAMDLYARLTGDEDAMDWTIAYGQAVARVLFQPKHANFHYNHFLVDFPVRGVARDLASWFLPEDATTGAGVPLSGYLAGFHPDVCARAYDLCGEPLLKQRAYDLWWGSSHRGYWTKEMHKLGEVGMWVGYYGPHSESVNFTQRTFQIHAHPRKDQQPPAAVTDLSVVREGGKTWLTFTAPADAGGGRVARYQVKASDRPLVDYESFLDHYAANTDAKVCNWWMAANLRGEPAPSAPGRKERFALEGLPEGARFLALRSFDDARNRSALSNVAQ